MKSQFVSVLLLCAGVAAAEVPAIRDNPSGTGHFILRLDKDRDGRVSRDEFDGPSDLFAHLDANKDNYIDRSEAPEYPEISQALLNPMDFITWMDRDGDSRIALAEFFGADAYFNFLDRNRDGYISLEEVPSNPLFCLCNDSDANAP